MGRRINTAVWMEKYNRWQIKVQKDNDRRTFTCSTPGRVGQRECNAKADAWLDDRLLSPGTRVDKLFPAWIEELKLTTGKSHWLNYDGYWRNWIKPAIGKAKVCNVTEQNLQNILNKAFAKGLSKKTLMKIRACLTAFIKYCRKCKATNLAVDDLTIPRNASVGERIILSPADLATLFSDDATVFRGKEVPEFFINAYRFEVSTGLRPGEVIGLKWSDIRGNRVVNLHRSINHFSETTRGKNDNAIRSFALKPLDIDILTKQKALMILTGTRSEFVFPDSYGDHIKQDSYYKHWIRYRDHHGLSEATPYELRHTFVSVIKSLPEGLIKPLVGHSENMDTLGTYSHEINGDMELTANLIQSTFAKILSEEKQKKSSAK